ncbi:MAG: Holliday junction resolvase RuvX [Candidatus Zambryskibacteria bacterium]|nr:Holliday junction resolvase RuvX [Candidatus Zambryskibacteria bacterium]
MKYLGIDFGSKRVGLAISDETNSYAFPLMVLNNSNNLTEELVEICKKNNVEEVVVGESKDFSQKDNEIMKEIIPFVKDLKNSLDLPIHMHPEFLTSQEAERLQGKNEMHDASAAALILKSYLDLRNNKN